MADKQKPEVEGEGSYSGAKDYNARTKTFLDREGDHVEQMAEEAEDALDPNDPNELSEAEKAGLEKAKH